MFHIKPLPRSKIKWGGRKNEQKWESLNVLIALVSSEIEDNVESNDEDQKANKNPHENKEKEKWFLTEHVNAKWHIYIQLRFRSFEIMRIIQIETKENVQVNSSAFNHSVIQHMLMVQYTVYKYTVMAAMVNDLTIGFEFQLNILTFLLSVYFNERMNIEYHRVNFEYQIAIITLKIILFIPVWCALV